MKGNKKQQRRHGVPEGRTVISARSGDADSLLSLLEFYKGYINSLSVIRYRFADGEEKVFYDEELHGNMIQKFIEATLKFKTGK